MLPRLRKITVEEVFLRDPEDFHLRLAARRAVPSTQPTRFEFELPPALREAVRQFFLDWYPFPLDPTDSFEQLTAHLQEDLILHARRGSTSRDLNHAADTPRDWMAHGHICLPSSWNPAHAIGRSLRELHAPIPGMLLDQSEKLVETMLQHGPFERFIWSVVFDERLNFHPTLPQSTFDPSRGNLFLKIERQVTVGFPAAEGALFLLTESLLQPDQIDLPALSRAIQAMSPAQLAYKGLAACRNRLLDWLHRQSR